MDANDRLNWLFLCGERLGFRDAASTIRDGGTVGDLEKLAELMAKKMEACGAEAHVGSDAVLDADMLAEECEYYRQVGIGQGLLIAEQMVMEAAVAAFRGGNDLLARDLRDRAWELRNEQGRRMVGPTSPYQLFPQPEPSGPEKAKGGEGDE